MAVHSPTGVSLLAFEALVDRLTPLTLTVSPTEGQTVVLADTEKEILLNLTPAADLDLVLIELPNNASSRIGQRVFVRSSRAIAEADFSGTTTVDNWMASFSAGDSLVFIKSADDVWSRVV